MNWVFQPEERRCSVVWRYGGSGTAGGLKRRSPRRKQVSRPKRHANPTAAEVFGTKMVDRLDIRQTLRLVEIEMLVLFLEHRNWCCTGTTSLLSSVGKEKLLCLFSVCSLSVGHRGYDVTKFDWSVAVMVLDQLWSRCVGNNINAASSGRVDRCRGKLFPACCQSITSNKDLYHETQTSDWAFRLSKKTRKHPSLQTEPLVWGPFRTWQIWGPCSNQSIPVYTVYSSSTVYDVHNACRFVFTCNWQRCLPAWKHKQSRSAASLTSSSVLSFLSPRY